MPNAEFVRRLVFHLLSIFAPADGVYDKHKTLLHAPPFSPAPPPPIYNEVHGLLSNVKWPILM